MGAFGVTAGEALSLLVRAAPVLGRTLHALSDEVIARGDALWLIVEAPVGPRCT